MLASLGIPLAIELAKKVIGKGVNIQLRKGKGPHVKRASAAAVFGSWGEKKNSLMYL